MSEQMRRRIRIASLIVPLCLVIAAALCWSAFSTYHYVESPVVPGYIAVMLIVALDGTVVVTTPVWLSAVLPPVARWYAAAICIGALLGSMGVNYAETGWPGIFPPMIAGALIHLVGVVLRSMRKADAKHEHAGAHDDESRVQKKVAPAPVKPAPKVSLRKPEPIVDAPIRRPLTMVPSIPAGGPRDIVWSLCEAAASDGRPEPTGPELLAAVRAAGHTVSNDYGRTTKAAWRKARKGVSA